MLETNLHLDDKDSELREKGQALIDAAYEFWRARQKVSSPGAVVWIKDTSGHFVLFTRGEYLNEIMSRINPLAAEEPLTSPFELPTDDLIAAAVYAEAWFTNRDCVDPHSMDYRAFQAADKLRGALGQVEAQKTHQDIIDTATAGFQGKEPNDQDSI